MFYRISEMKILKFSSGHRVPWSKPRYLYCTVNKVWDFIVGLYCGLWDPTSPSRYMPQSFLPSPTNPHPYPTPYCALDYYTTSMLGFFSSLNMLYLFLSWPFVPSVPSPPNALSWRWGYALTITQIWPPLCGLPSLTASSQDGSSVPCYRPPCGCRFS